MDEESTLSKQLSSALASRDKRLIRRRLPDPLPSPSATTSTSSPSSPNHNLRKNALTPNDCDLKPTATASNEKQDEKEDLIDFTSNDYLSLTTSPSLRDLFIRKLLSAPDVLGSGGSRLLVNGAAHDAFERRMERFFNPPSPSSSGSSPSSSSSSPASSSSNPTSFSCETTKSTANKPTALLFNSGFDANVGFFSCIPQPSSALIYDEYIHASVHDGMRASRIPPSHRLPFLHNDAGSLRAVLSKLVDMDEGFERGERSVFVSVESLYSMDGTLSPLLEFNAILEELFPKGNAYLIVDEAHSTGLYGPEGRGRVVQLGLHRRGRVLARLHTFGKALGASGAVIITTELVRDYLLNYARALIYTTALPYANVIAAEASFDLLEDGTADQLSKHLFSLSSHLVSSLTPHLSSIPPHILSLPSHLFPSPSRASSSPSHRPTPLSDPTPPTHTPIIPLLTTSPRPLAAFLRAKGMNARPITWPTVPKGKGRVRVCLHAGLGRPQEGGDGDGEKRRGLEEVDRLVSACVEWARGEVERERGVEVRSRL